MATISTVRTLKSRALFAAELTGLSPRTTRWLRVGMSKNFIALIESCRVLYCFAHLSLRLNGLEKLLLHDLGTHNLGTHVSDRYFRPEMGVLAKIGLHSLFRDRCRKRIGIPLPPIRFCMELWGELFCFCEGSAPQTRLQLLQLSIVKSRT